MLEKFEEYMEKERLSENSISSYKNDVKIFIDFFKDKFGEDIIKLNHIIITEYIKELKNANRKAETINRKIAAICKYNHFLVETGVQEDIVVRNKDYIKLQPKLMAPYSPSEKEILKFKLSAKDDKRDLAILTLLAHGGPRESEIVNIELTDVNFESKTIIIKGKGNKVRIIVIADVVYDALKDYVEERTENGTLDKNKYLFIGRQKIEENKPLHRTTINAIIKKYSTNTGIYAHPHLLRDYFCTELSRKKALTEVQIAALAGHNSINTTRKYIKIEQEDLLAGVNQI